MHSRLTTFALRPGTMQAALDALEPRVAARDGLLGCWATVLGEAPRIHLLQAEGAASDHEARRRAVVDGLGLDALQGTVETIESAVYAPLPCSPALQAGTYGAVYEIRIYELQPAGALEAAYRGWDAVIAARLALAPITTVMHSVDGRVPRLVHVYPYRSLAHREEVRRQAVATGVWPPKGGADRNRVMRTELAVPARFSPLC